MQTIRLKHKHYTGPGNWAELDKTGLLYIAAITGLTRFKRFRPHYLVIKLFKLPWRDFLALKECQKIQLEQCLDWMKEPNSLTKWLITCITIWGRKFHGPKGNLSNLTVEEFMFAEAAYTQWLEVQQASVLDTLFAALYRRHSCFGSVRRAFSEKEQAAGEKAAASIRPHVKVAISLNYAGCRNNIIAKHPNVWKKSETNPNEPLMAPPMLQKVNWAGLALELSGDKFGTYNQTIKMNLWIFLADMDKKAKRAAEMEAKK